MKISREELIDAINVERIRIFGKDGFSFEETKEVVEAYEWLEANYNISELEDVNWLFIVFGDVLGELNDDDPDDIELIELLNNEVAGDAFLIDLLKKYRSNAIAYPKIHPKST